MRPTTSMTASTMPSPAGPSRNLRDTALLHSSSASSRLPQPYARASDFQTENCRRAMRSEHAEQPLSDEAMDAVGMPRRVAQGDEAAHRAAVDVRALDADRVEQAGHVVGPDVERVALRGARLEP